jgi:hypothetical protein
MCLRRCRRTHSTRPGNAAYVPPPPEKMIECSDWLEKFVHREHEELPILVKAALVHVGFVHSQEFGAEMNLLRSELGHRVYATHFILSFLRFLAQSTR